MSYACKDCKYWHRLSGYFGRCDADEREYWEETPFCVHFKTTDGKTPRFCRLASSIDEMAKLMVVQCFQTDKWWFFRGKIYYTKEEIVAAVKAWLMKVEE